MKTKCRIICLLIPLFMLGSVAVVAAQPGHPGMDPLTPIKDVLLATGAPELTSEQENSIRTLISEFRNAHQIPNMRADIQNAREEYENAILNSDYDTAASQAAIIANAQAAEMAGREKDAAFFAIETIALLKKNAGQYEALIDITGRNGLVRMVLDLIGVPGGKGPGPGGQPPPKTLPMF